MTDENKPMAPAPMGQVQRQLGPLPEPRWPWAGSGPRPYEDAYSADQMRAYAAAEVAAEVAAERERCAKIVEDLVRAVDGADALAAIRGPNVGANRIDPACRGNSG